MRINTITWFNHEAAAAMVASASDADVRLSFVQALRASCSPSSDLADFVGLFLTRRELRRRGLLPASTRPSAA